jgi:phage baseplate assembly protein W
MAADASQPRAFLGRGWSFPYQLDASGEVRMAELEEDIRQSVHIILETDLGERVMRPDFGAGLRALAFEPIGAATTALVRHRIEQALIAWEPRIDSLTVSATADPPRGRLMVEIRYRVRSTNTFYNLVYPFYLIEGRQ